MARIDLVDLAHSYSGDSAAIETTIIKTADVFRRIKFIQIVSQSVRTSTCTLVLR